MNLLKRAKDLGNSATEAISKKTTELKDSVTKKTAFAVETFCGDGEMSTEQLIEKRLNQLQSEIDEVTVENSFVTGNTVTLIIKLRD